MTTSHIRRLRRLTQILFLTQRRKDAKRKSLPIAASAPVKAGEKIFTVGYPNYAIQGTEPKYTEGVVMVMGY